MKTNGKMLILLVILTVAEKPMAQAPSLKITPGMELQLSGITNNYYRFESSTDLLNWGPQGSYFQLMASPYSMTVVGTNLGWLFFRARSLPSSWMVMNNSYPDTCAEDDNVNIAFRGNVTNFSIMATHPVNYQPADYTCASNFTNCQPDTSTNYYFDNPQLWQTQYSWNSFGAWMNWTRESSFWRPQGMAVALNGSWSPDATNIHEVDIGRQIVVSGSGGEAPGYFTLYSDGYMRLIPFPPLGQPSVCFGSSVVIGPAAICSRPYADILSADFRTTNQTVFVTYRNGGTALIDFSTVTRTNANVTVTVNYPTDQSYCTFRSMYVTDGNSDCDHVLWQDLNGVTTTNSIMSFSGLSGTNWFFYRQTPSVQRQSAPDIRIIPY